MKEVYDKDYYEAGPQTGKSLYQNYRWIPELTLPMAHHIVKMLDIDYHESVLDFGCAKGYLVHALRMLGYRADGFEVSQYAIQQAPAEVQRHLYRVSNPLTWECMSTFDYIIAKDVLEHINYEHLDETIKILLTNTRKKFMGIVPLASDGSVYDIRAYELDSTHKIRESIDWWRDKFFKHAMNQDRKVDVNVTFDLGQLKNNWTKVNPKGNALIIVEFKEQ